MILLKQRPRLPYGEDEYNGDEGPRTRFKEFATNGDRVPGWKKGSGDPEG
jgi:hypothetical protein